MISMSRRQKKKTAKDSRASVADSAIEPLSLKSKRLAAKIGTMWNHIEDTFTRGSPSPAASTLSERPARPDDVVVVEVEDLSQDDVIIALMGPTGAGKSSFVNTVTGHNSGIGHSLESCTADIGMVKIHDIILVDTPGFDDTHKTDMEILSLIADWLTETYKREIKLAGILYFHRISDNRVAGTPLKNLHMFEKLCGKNAFENIILTTTMWDKVGEDIGAQREKELKGEYWKAMIKQGSKTIRYRNTRESAWEILDSIIGHKQQAVLLQKEMVDMERQLRETDAGQTLYSALESLVRRQQDTLEEIRSETMRQADPSVLKHLQDEYEDLRKELQTTIADMQKLQISMGKRFLRFCSTALSFRP